MLRKEDIFVAKRLTTFLTANKYINTSVQNGGVPRFSGSVEYTSTITQLIRQAKAGRKVLTVVWLNLANAYGSIAHQLIYTALRHYHVDSHIQKIQKRKSSPATLMASDSEVGEENRYGVHSFRGIVHHGDESTD